jgi:hypothetical protein
MRIWLMVIICFVMIYGTSKDIKEMAYRLLLTAAVLKRKLPVGQSIQLHKLPVDPSLQSNRNDWSTANLRFNFLTSWSSLRWLLVNYSKFFLDRFFFTVLPKPMFFHSSTVQRCFRLFRLLLQVCTSRFPSWHQPPSLWSGLISCLLRCAIRKSNARITIKMLIFIWVLSFICLLIVLTWFHI